MIRTRCDFWNDPEFRYHTSWLKTMGFWWNKMEKVWIGSFNNDKIKEYQKEITSWGWTIL